MFTRNSDFSGTSILSFFPPDSDYTVISEEEWWKDDWDPMEYGQDFDFSRPFFEQFDELMHKVPLMARSVTNNQNCDYINNAGWNKNCYLIAGANNNEDCYYGNFINHCKTTMDSNFVHKCELCYECVDCKDCYNLKYSTNCHNCSDSYFLYNCRGSRNCFGSVNLSNREYVFFNEQLTKEEYEKKIAGLNLDKASRIEEAKKFFEEHRLKYPHKFMMGDMNENVTGNAINECRNVTECFDVTGLEDCKYCIWLHDSKSCMDIYAWGYPGTEECYDCMEVGQNSRHVLFSALVYNGINTYYSHSCFQVEDIFGCASLRRKKYCILNKQYTKEKYEELVPKIIEHMKKTGEWGEFFPMKLSVLAYNNSIAQDYLPVSKEEALNMGARWRDEDPIQKPAEKVEIPDSINDIDKSICDQTLTCEETGKAYKIIPQEFDYYKLNGIPIPRFCFDIRHKNRFARRNPRKLWDRKCDKCQTDISTSYSTDSSEIVYCEACYLKEVY